MSQITENAEPAHRLHCLVVVKSDIRVISIVSAFLLIYTVCAATGTWIGLVFVVGGTSPFLVIWMVWVVLKHGEYYGPDLTEDEEFGYVDRQVH